MERLQKGDEDAGIERHPVSDAQKAAIGEARNFYEAKTCGAGSAAPLTAPRRRSIPPSAPRIEGAAPPRPRAALVRTGVEDRKDPPRRRATVTTRSYTPVMRRTTVLVMGIGLCSVVMLAESAGGLQWTTPEGWKNQGALPMRVATYAVAPVGWR